MVVVDKTYVTPYKLLFDAMLEGGAEAIVKAGSEIFASPVALIDDNCRLICQFPNEPIGDPVWDTLLKEHVIKPDTIQEFQFSFLNESTNAAQPFYADWAHAKEMSRIIGALSHEGQLVGHAAIFLGKRPFADDDLELAQLFINALNIEFRNKLENCRWKCSPAAHLQDLLREEAPAQVKNLAQQNLRKLINGSVALLVTPFGENTAKRTFATEAVTELSLRYHHIVSVIHENAIVTLIGEIDSSHFQHAESPFTKEIVNFFARQKLVSGLSDCFRDFYEIPAHYKQALLTAKLAAKKGETFLGVYRDYAPMQMFLELAEKGNYKAYIHPALVQIRLYDELQNSEYFKTLRTFCLTMQNIDAAALKLSVPRNTLLHRLNRMKSLFDLSYEDEHTALHLLTSFLLLDVVE